MNRDQFSSVFLDQSKDLFWVIDFNYHLLEANRAYLNLAKINTGKEQQLNQTVLSEALSEAETEKWKAHYDRALKGEHFEIEEHYFNPDSKQTEYIQVAFQPLKSEKGDVYAVACLSKDITTPIKQRKEADQLMDASLDVFCTVDEFDEFVFVSGASTRLWGYKPEELVGKSIRSLVVEEDLPKTNKLIKEILEGKEVKTFSNRYKKKDGGIAYNLWSSRWDSHTRRRYAVARDAEEKTRQEEKVQLSEERLKALVQGAFDLVGIVDQDGFYTYMGPSSMALTGFAPEAFIGKNAFEFVHPKDRERVLESVNKVKTQKREAIKPFRSKNHKNEWRWLETVLTNMLDNPAVQGIVVNTRDITSKFEERHKQKLLESVVTNTKDAVLITEAEPLDEPGPKIIYVNEAFTKMTGYEASEVIGKTPRILQGPKSDFEGLAKLGAALRNWEPYDITTVNYKKSGEEFWINFTVTPVADENGWYTHWIAIERDVTEQKNQELENKLLAQISICFGAKNGLSAATEELCKTIAEFGKFDWVEVWASNFESSRMQLLNHFVAEPKDEVFYDYDLDLNNFEISKGLAGQVWNEKAQLLWDHDEINKKFLRKDAANMIGLKAILGIPLTLNSEVIGVIKVGTKADKNYLKSFTAIFQKLESFIGSELNRKKLENDLSHIFDAVPDIVAVLDFKGKFLKINKAGSELLGSSTENIINKAFSEFTHPSETDLFKQKLNLLQKKDGTFKFESRVLSEKDEVIWLSWYCSPVPEEGLVYATAKDITEEISLRDLNEQVGRLAKIGSWEVDLVNQTVFWSDEVHEIHETDSKTFVPSLEAGINFYRADFREMVQSEVENTIATGESWDFEAVIVTAKKNELWIRSIGNAEFENGKCVSIYGGFQDIDTRKQSENKLISLAQNLPGIVYEYHISPDGKDSLKNISGKVEELWGFTPEQLMEDMSVAWRQIEAAGKIAEVQESIRQSIESKSKWQSRIKYIMPNTGKLRTHLGFGTPSFLADGTIVFNSMILDITQQAVNEDLLEQTTKVARVGSWEMDLLNQEGESMHWSPMIYEILELEHTYQPTLRDGIEFHVGKSKDKISKALKLLIEKGVEFDEEILLRTAKGNERWSRAIGKSQIVNNKRTRIYGSYQDIHEKKMATLALETSLKQLQDYKFSLDQSAIIAFTDQKGQITSVNDNFCKISGFSKEELIGKTHQIINANHHPPSFFKDLWKTIASGKVFRGEIKNKAKDGSYYWVDTTIVPFLNEKGKPKQYLAIRFDVSDRKKAEADILKANERFEKVTEATNDAIWDWDIVNDRFYRSKAFERFFGVKTSRALSQADFWKDNFHPEDKDNIRKSVEEAISNPKTLKWKMEYRILNDAEEVLYVIDQGIIIRNKKGKATRMVGAMTDITDQKKSEGDARFKANLLQTVGQAAIATDLEGEVNYWNKAAEVIYGWTAEEAIGKNIDLLRPREIDEEEEKKIAQALEKGQIWSGEYIVQKKDGTKFPVRASNAPVYNEKHELIGMIGISSDTTQEVENEKLLKQYTKDLESSNEKLRKIAWTQSHVVRAPLSRILGIINLIELQDGKMDDILTWVEQLKISTQEMDEIVKKIVNEANHLD